MGAPLPRDLEQIRDPPLAQHLDPIERERRPRAGTHETLATDIVVGREAHGTVNIEPVARRREAPLAPLEVPVFRIGQGKSLDGECRPDSERLTVFRPTGDAARGAR
jgi:hypothetical protein